ncbi:MAG: hypothetical protein AAGF11_52455 [Myxococcota bacterium]
MTTTTNKRRWALGLMLLGACGPGELSRAAVPVSMEASTYAVAPTCGPAKVRSLRAVLPDDGLQGVMEVDVGALQRSPLFRDHRSLFEAEAREVLDGMNACGVPLSKVDRLVAGFTMGDDVVLGVRATGLAQAKTLDCLAREIGKSTGTPAWSRTTTGCSTTLEIDGGKAKGFAVGRDMLVVASASLAGAVERRIEGKDVSALDGKLRWARREVDMGHTAWVAGNLPPAVAAGMGSMSGLDHVGLSVDATKGLGLQVSMGFVSPRDATAAKTELSGLVIQARAMLPMVGLPESVADTITLEARGRAVRLGVFLRPRDVEALSKTLEGAMGGSSSSPSSPAPRRGM